MAHRAGEWHLELRLFDFLPLRHILVQVLPEVRVVPGGQAIGVLLQGRGVVVVDLAPVVDTEGRTQCPAAEAGIAPGDVILKVGGHAVGTEEEIRNLVDQAGRAGGQVEMEVRQGERTVRRTVRAVYCPETGRYRVGLLVKDSAAGVGTLTFYDPVTGRYGALGHVVSDHPGGQKIDLAEGRIVEATILRIRAGQRGQPGEKIGVFTGASGLEGSIDRNTPCGIFGVLRQLPEANPFYPEPVPVALADQVRPGPAEVLTVLEDGRVERFGIEITRVLPQRFRDRKGLVFKVTDERLLGMTGGIVQGMSGSPILQDGRLVGAVTHVFVNDPTRGYGTFAEWMLREVEMAGDRA
ncbi:MAG: SpoIVB peptidase [Firmicutes bacterium]|nr:SpoIVB peptidase [Bacillota bacterium]